MGEVHGRSAPIVSARLRRRRRTSGSSPHAAPDRRPRRWPGRIVRWILLPVLLLVVLVVAGVAGVAYVYWPTDLPPAKALEEYTPSVGRRALLFALRRRRARGLPRCLRELPPRPRGGRREHHHAAARKGALSHAGP